MNHKIKPTIKDVAEAAGVSVMTVSRALNNKGASPKTRERISRIANEIGYVANPMAKGLRSRSNTIGVVVADITRSFAGELVRNLSIAADRFGYRIVLYAQGEIEHSKRSKHYATQMTSGIIDGVIFNSMVNYAPFLRHLKLHGVPYVLTDRHDDKTEPTVFSTGHRGMVDATRHLLTLGHDRIAFISGPRSNLPARERLQGHCDTLTEVGIPVDNELIFDGDFGRMSGFDIGRKILSMNPAPTAIIASNDSMAFGVMEVIREKGLEIGTDISLIGFDDIALAQHVKPSLTTVRQHIGQIATEAIELLIDLIEQREVIQLQHDLPTELIVRQTTGRRR